METLFMLLEWISLLVYDAVVETLICTGLCLLIVFLMVYFNYRRTQS